MTFILGTRIFFLSFFQYCFHIFKVSPTQYISWWELSHFGPLPHPLWAWTFSFLGCILLSFFCCCWTFLGVSSPKLPFGFDHLFILFRTIIYFISCIKFLSQVRTTEISICRDPNRCILFACSFLIVYLSSLYLVCFPLQLMV